MAAALTARERRALAAAIGLLVAVRLATLGAYPLMDSTESRYAEIARKMLEVGDWVMLQFDYGVPFWGKPPLSTWLAAGSMAVFGINEFAARLPSFALLAGCGALVYALARQRGGGDQALWTLAAFAATGLVFVAGGAVMTDPALAFGTTISMAAFWGALRAPAGAGRASGYLFFVGLAVGLLAKGPVALVLALVPIAGWTLWTREWRRVASALPWLTGTLLAAALAVPWYWAGERTAPGFLDYFLVGEHWKRFVEPGWKGDLYGTAHARPRGMIWLFWIAAALPWSIFAIAWLGRAAASRRADLGRLIADPWRRYLLLWATTPMLFFTLSGNVLATYVLPGLPAFALLLGELWRPGAAATAARRVRPAVRVMMVACAVLAVAFAGGIGVMSPRFEAARSHKALVVAYDAARGDASAPLVYVGDPPMSAEFYAQGSPRHVADAAALRPLLAGATRTFVAVRAREAAQLPPDIEARLAPVGDFGDYRLFGTRPG